MTLQALRRLAQESIPPPRTVFFGSPLGHPVWSKWLGGMGYDLPAPVEVVNLYNVDDPIVGGDPKFPVWMRNVRVAVPDGDVGPFQWEHEASLYLTHPNMIRELQALR